MQKIKKSNTKTEQQNLEFDRLKREMWTFKPDSFFLFLFGKQKKPNKLKKNFYVV